MAGLEPPPEELIPGLSTRIGHSATICRSQPGTESRSLTALNADPDAAR
jgi:hypothetical protein